jgi:Vault protein inter-alpha-trypsin domain
MTLQSFGHPLHTLNNGVVGFAENIRSTPQVSMNISVHVENGLAKIITTRTFENHEEVPIEAILTAPVSFQAVLTRLSAKIDGRELTAKAQSRDGARAAFEDAIDRGKLAILHEEPLRGLHIISIAPLAPKQKVEVVTVHMMSLANVGNTSTLHIPTTVGELYGASPLLPVDDVVVGDNALRIAKLQVDSASGEAFLNGALVNDTPLDIDLTRQIIITFPQAEYGRLQGYDAYGRRLSVTLQREETSALALNLAVLFDRSGSTSAHIGDKGSTVWSSMRDGLKKSLLDLQEADAISLWQFDSDCQRIGSANGAHSSALVEGIGSPAGGTELGSALEQLNKNASVKDILILTDGQTWAAEAQAIAAMGYRISAVLVGEGSFDGVIGQLAFMTGGEIFPANGSDVGPAISSALRSLRSVSAAAEGALTDGKPDILKTKRSGLSISINWDRQPSSEPSDDIGRYVAALALPLIAEEHATEFAAAHNLCTHLTSLLLVDEEGKTIEGVPEQRKIELAHSAQSVAYYAPAIEMFSIRQSVAERKDVIMSCSYSPIISSTIDWNNLANQLLIGDVTGLDAAQIDLVYDLAGVQEIRDLAIKLGLDSIVVVIGLLAKCDAGKTAERIARKILTQASSDDLKEPLEIVRNAYDRLCAQANF